MKLPIASVLLLALSMGCASAQESRQINTCFEEWIASLRLSQLEQGIDYCDRVIADRTASAELRGQAFGSRGLMYARQFAVLGNVRLAQQGIEDITEALRLFSPGMERRHQLLIIRAQLNMATGQTRRAFNDYTTIINEDPKNNEAIIARDRLGSDQSM